MKTLANLASDGPKRKRRGAGEYDDDFGANDEDWGVYRTVAKEEGSDDEEPEADPIAELLAVEKDLLEYDPTFTPNDTLEAQRENEALQRVIAKTSEYVREIKGP